MSTNLPPQPAAPDYAEANREGIYTDIETLPIRRQIDQAARMGQSVSYWDPSTNSYRTADFSGMGDIELARQAAKLATETNADVQRQQLALREELGMRNVAQTAKEIEAADPVAYQTRQEVTKRLLGDLGEPETTIAPNARLMELTGAAPSNDWRLSSLYGRTSGVDANVSDFGQIDSLKRLQAEIASDPGAAPALQALAREAAGSGQASTRQLGDIYEQATRLPSEFTDAATAALNPALQSAIDDYALGGKLNNAELRDTTNNVRAGQMARGNFLGDAAAVAEAVAQNAASDAKKQQRLRNLLDVQSQVFGQNDALRDDSTAAAQAKIATLAGLTGQQAGLAQSLRGEQAGYTTTAADQKAAQRQQLAQIAAQIFGTGNAVQTQSYAQELQKLGLLGNLSGQDFAQNQQAYAQRLNAAQIGAAEEKAARNEGFGREQQKLANASAMVLGQPITNQFGSLQGAQQGAVAFTPVNYSGGIGLNANAGLNAANFAQQSFGTNANMWTTAANIAQQDNAGMMSMISGMAGSAMGAMI
jgi:hypothetical protein